MAGLDLRIAKYQQLIDVAKLAVIDATWPREERFIMGHEAAITVEIFGSSEVRQVLRAWQDAADLGDEAGMKAAYQAGVALAHNECPQQTSGRDQVA